MLSLIVTLADMSRCCCTRHIPGMCAFEHVVLASIDQRLLHSVMQVTRGGNVTAIEAAAGSRSLYLPRRTADVGTHLALG